MLFYLLIPWPLCKHADNGLYTCMYECMRIYAQITVYDTNMHILARACVIMCMSVYMCVCMCGCLCMHVLACMCVHLCG